MEIKMAIRKRLERKLLSKMKHLLWSYDVSKIDELPEDLIIEKYLQFGNKQDWNDLLLAFDQSKIKDVWERQMLLSGRELEKQKKIVEHFFHAKNPGRYISDRKRRKLNNLVARGI